MPPSGHPPRQPRKTILIIDDQPDLLEAVTSMLEVVGFRVVSASNGRAGLAAARAERPDLVLCDVTMPGFNGHQVLEALRGDATTAAVPFIFLTALGDRSDLRTGMNLGADDYLTKPAAPQEIVQAMEARLNRQRIQDRRLEHERANPPPEFSLRSPEPLRGLGLTPREAEVLFWVAQGKTNAEVGIILGMSDRTANKHLEHVFKKLGVSTRSAATLAALEFLGRNPASAESS